jgi:4-hydroxythreonine-4-phosphate dehydrogenase
VVVGSASSVSRRQLEELRRDPGVILIRISPKVLLEGPGAPGWRPASRSLVAAIGRPGKDVVMAAIDPDAPVDPASGPRLAAALGQFVGPQLSRFSALVATGGETARNLLEAIGLRSLLVERELEPGIPLSSLEGNGLPVVTKAGAFGNPQSLVRCVQALRALPLARHGVSGASLPPSAKESP